MCLQTTVRSGAPAAPCGLRRRGPPAGGAGGWLVGVTQSSFHVIQQVRADDGVPGSARVMESAVRCRDGRHVATTLGVGAVRWGDVGLFGRA